MTTDNGTNRLSTPATSSFADGPVLARAKSDLLGMAHDEGEVLSVRRAAMNAARNIAIVERALDKASLFTLRNRLVALKPRAVVQQGTEESPLAPAKPRTRR